MTAGESGERRTVMRQGRGEEGKTGMSEGRGEEGRAIELRLKKLLRARDTGSCTAPASISLQLQFWGSQHRPPGSFRKPT